jgi:alkyl hydroperoxide reductase subunit AhpC
LVQQPAPQFTAKAVLGNDIKELSLSQYQGKYVILLFYPLDFTFVCPTELIAFSDRAKDFRALNCEIIGISVDSEYSHLAWSQLERSRGGLAPCDIPLVADLDKAIAKKYGVLVGGQVALRGLFIIDPQGIVRQATINDLPIGRSVDEALRLVQAIQFVEKHGEVCPANWTPGAPTMKADPVGSKAYFSKQA